MTRYGYLYLVGSMLVTAAGAFAQNLPTPLCGVSNPTCTYADSTERKMVAGATTGIAVYRSVDGMTQRIGFTRNGRNGHGGGPSLLQRGGFGCDIAELLSVHGLRPSLRGSSRQDGRLRHHQRDALGHADLPGLARSQQSAAVPEGLAGHRYELLSGQNGVHRALRWRSIPVLFGQQSLLEWDRRTGWAQ